ncbi:glycosyl hydrolase family 18 protein [Ferviditalea candida]|uniref:Glycosyl hydrolase family 18 protein n=1 Tax=Ferviditalea candida TaxID=3108399 RepID=A0ABU5ZI10_9BACL|nr:glycosyl hydrolase family 18 protein [Paenibacillaceae bacterium T2]
MENQSISRIHSRKTPGSRIPAGLLFLLLLVAAGTGMMIFILWDKYSPNNSRVFPDFHGFDHPIYYRGQLLNMPALGSGESLKFPLPVIQDKIDSTAVYEQESDSVIITTQDKVLRMRTDRLTAMLNEQPMKLSFPVEKTEGAVYLPMVPLKTYFQINWSEAPDTGAVLLMKDGDVLQWGKANLPENGKPQQVPLRTHPTIRAPIVAELPNQGDVMIWKEVDDWYLVQLPNGITGYVPKTKLVLDRTEVITASDKSRPFIPWSPVGGKIVMSWEQVINKNPDTSQISDMPGLNVISPTWFHLERNQKGDYSIRNQADPAYVKWAHDQGYQVWALFSNSFDPDWTTEAIATYDSRMKLIRQLLAFAEMYDLQGINIDFENVYVKDKAKLTQFVKEMTPLMHEQNLVVSIDVTVRGGSPNWSLFFDREALAKTVDYMIVMTYDEHWASSPDAGSVASLPWMEKGVADLIEHDHVPSNKLIMGIPFYTRLWTETVQQGKTPVKSKAVQMSYVQRVIREKKLQPKFDPATGQLYIEYPENGNTVKIWIEDEGSVQSRMKLISKYDLAGVAAWKRGFETPEIWNVIERTLQKRP